MRLWTMGGWGRGFGNARTAPDNGPLAMKVALSGLCRLAGRYDIRPHMRGALRSRTPRHAPAPEFPHRCNRASYRGIVDVSYVARAKGTPAMYRWLGREWAMQGFSYRIWAGAVGKGWRKRNRQAWRHVGVSLPWAGGVLFIFIVQYLCTATATQAQAGTCHVTGGRAQQRLLSVQSS